MEKISEIGARRELKTRKKRWARHMAKILADRNISPNNISILGLACAFFSGSFYFFAAGALWILAFSALLIQLRLLCNMLDGLVAIEGGKKTKNGMIFNEVPDRIADMVILISAGYAAQSPELGYFAALTALLTAYVRVFGGSIGLVQDFRGPMAKQHRMAVLTLGTVLGILDLRFLLASLLVIVLGGLITFFVRLALINKNLEGL